MTSLKQLKHAFEQTPLPPYRTYFMDAPIHINFKETYGERISYLPIFLLEFWNSPGKIDVSVLQNKARKALLKSGIQKWSNIIDK